MVTMKSLAELFEALLEQPYWLITSRPHAAQGLLNTGGVRVDRKLEGIGFNEEQIENYVTVFFGDTPDRAAALTQLFQKNPAIFGTAHVPLNLALICGLWKDPSEAWGNVEDITMTALYEKIDLWLRRRYLKNHIKEEAPEDWLLDDFEKDPRYGPVLECLETLAWMGLQGNNLLLSFQAKDLKEVIDTYREKTSKIIDNEEHRKWSRTDFHQCLKDVGFLKYRQEQKRVSLITTIILFTLPFKNILQHATSIAGCAQS